MNYLALFVTLPSRQSAGRMRLWRALRNMGAATLRDGVYLLPESDANAAALAPLVADIRGVEGSAEIYSITGRDDEQAASLRQLFDRSEQFAALLAAIRAADAAEAKTVRALRRDFLALSAIDFFPGEAQRQVAAALAQLEAAASGEPTAGDGPIRHLKRADFQGRTWATRRHLWVDRMASAWLIRRFIDADARFVWLDAPHDCPPEALGFDFDGAAFTHTGGLVSFEVLLASFGLSENRALAQLAAIVHYLDEGGVPVPAATGIEAVLAGARASAKDDDALLAEATRLFDHLYRHYAKEPTDD